MLTHLPFDPCPRRAPTPAEPLTVNQRRLPADVRVPSATPGRVHLEKGGLWQALVAN